MNSEPAQPLRTEFKVPELSYANQRVPLAQRLAIRTMEQISGRRQLYQRYYRYLESVVGAETQRDYWDRAVQALGIHDTRCLPDLPRLRPGKGLLMIANHPFGVADGVLLSWIASRFSEDFLVIAIGLLTAEPTLSPNILPINFDVGQEAVRENVLTRRRAIDQLKQGGVVALFPAGAISWSRQKGLPVEDEDWKPLLGRLIKDSGCDVLPVFFQGGNSEIFQFFSRHLMLLRMGLNLHEVRKGLDQRVQFRLGEVVPFEDLPRLSDQDLAHYMRRYVERLRD